LQGGVSLRDQLTKLVHGRDRNYNDLDELYRGKRREIERLESHQVSYPNYVERAIAETQEAIRRVLAGAASEELRPASAEVRRLQHEMARSSNLVSHSYGNEPRRRVRIFPA
jgi:hypothetical protein